MKNSLSVQTSVIYYTHIRLIIGFIIIAHARTLLYTSPNTPRVKRINAYTRISVLSNDLCLMRHDSSNVYTYSRDVDKISAVNG